MVQRSAVPGSFLSARQRFFLNASRLASFLLLILLLAAPSSVAAQAAGTDQQGLTNESILKMLRGGLGEEVILTSVEHQPGKYSLGVDEMIALRDAGVSDKVIQAMLRKAAAPPPPAAAPLVLADGTLVNLRLRKSLSSATAAQGQTVELEVTRELKVGDVVVAPVGAIAEGVVSEARTAKRGNIGGKLEVSLRRLRLVDGTEASLRTIPQSQSAVKKAAKTAGNIGKAVTFMGLKHGKEQVLDAGKTITAYVDGSVTLGSARVLAAARPATPAAAVAAAATVAVAPAATAAAPAAEPAHTAAPPQPSLLLAELPPVRPAAPRKEYYILNVKPPSVTIVSSDDMRALANVPLDAEPTYALTGPTGRYLYVLQNGLFHTSGDLAGGLGRLAIVDLDSREIAKSVQLAWNINKLALSKDGKYLICVSQGKAVTKKASEEEQGSVQIFSTTTNESVATLTAGRDGTQVVYNSDLSRLAILTKGKRPAKKGGETVKPVVTVFTLAQEKPLAEIELEWGTTMELSPDDKWVYILDQGEMTKKVTRNGVVHVIDLQAATLVKTLDAGASPRWSLDHESGVLSVLARNSFKDDHGLLIRYHGPEAEPPAQLSRSPLFLRPLQDGAGSYVATYEDLRLIGSSGALAPGAVPLNPKQHSGDITTLGGNVPGETLYLPLKNRLATTLQNRAGGPTSKVAILDLSGNRVQHVVTTGRGSVKFGKFEHGQLLRRLFDGGLHRPAVLLL